MKKTIALVLAGLAVTAAAASAMAAEPACIPWAFDDFDSNGELIETAEAQPAEPGANKSVAGDEPGELGW